MTQIEQCEIDASMTALGALLPARPFLAALGTRHGRPSSAPGAETVIVRHTRIFAFATAGERDRFHARTGAHRITLEYVRRWIAPPSKGRGR